jgi:ribose transport system ATP-binding protein
MNDLHPTTPRLRVTGIRKRFGATLALDGVDLTVERGQVLAVVGENGAGKSTLMKVLSGAHRPDDGQMWLDGEAYAPRTPMDARRAGVSMIYQELSLAPHLSVMENILLGMEPTRGPFVKWDEIRRRAVDALRQLGRPDIRPEAIVSRLSPADRQLVEIGRAIVVGCRVLVLDEPTSSLTTADIRHLFDLVRRLKADGHSILYISHFLEEVREISDRFTVLRDGKTVGGGRTTDVPVSRIIQLMVGREVADLYPRSARTPGEVVLEVNSLQGARGPQNASLQLRRGEVLGIAGLVGAGRTELLRTIFGLDPVRAGQVRISTFVGPASPARRWAQGVGMVSEDRKVEGLALSLSIAENLTLSNLANLGPAGLVMPRRQDTAARRWVQRLAIKCRSPRQVVSSLSGGNQQKIALARLLHHGADVLLLDEPTRGIDVGSKAQVYQLIDELAAGDRANQRKPCAVLMVSSYLPELLGVCDRIAVMYRGTLGAARAVEDVTEHEIMLEATGTESEITHV